LKPLLIYKYERDEMHRQDDFIELMMSDGNLLGSIYGQLGDDLLYSNNENAMHHRVSIAMSTVAQEK